jgi:hypothetical protein
VRALAGSEAARKRVFGARSPDTDEEDFMPDADKLAATAVATATGAAVGFSLVRLAQRRRREGQAENGRERARSSASRDRRPAPRDEDLATVLKDVAIEMGIALADAARGPVGRH